MAITLFLYGIVAGVTLSIIIAIIIFKHAEKLCQEIESEPDHNTPQFISSTSGKRLEGIKKYGVYIW